MRLIGVDTPETVDSTKPVERFGKEASDFTKGLLTGRKVRLEFDPTGDMADRYVRTLTHVYRDDGLLLNKELIARGYGFAYTRFPFSKMDEFRAAEREAREKGLWLWGPDPAPGGAPAPPARKGP